MTALDAFLWTLTAWMWLLMAGVLAALGVTIWDDVKRRRAERVVEAPRQPATLHMIRPSGPEPDDEFRHRILNRFPLLRHEDPALRLEIEMANGHALDALAVRLGMGRRIGDPTLTETPKESA